MFHFLILVYWGDELNLQDTFLQGLQNDRRSWAFSPFMHESMRSSLDVLLHFRKYNKYLELFFLDRNIPFRGHSKGAGACPCCIWAKAKYSCWLIHCPLWAFEGKVPCSNVPQQWLKVSWHLLPLPEHLPSFVRTGGWTRNPQFLSPV